MTKKKKNVEMEESHLWQNCLRQGNSQPKCKTELQKLTGLENKRSLGSHTKFHNVHTLKVLLSRIYPIILRYYFHKTNYLISQHLDY